MKLALCLLSLLAGTEAFVPAVTQQVRRFDLQMAVNDDQHQNTLFGAAVAAAIFLAAPLPAHSSSVDDFPSAITPFASSTVQIADTIKELDMSLPSYGDIKDSKASVENVGSLSKEPSKGGVVAPRTKKSSSTKASKPKQQKGSSMGYNF